MNEKLMLKAAETAGEYHDSGYNCAESIFLTFRESAAPGLTEDMVRIASPFGGGLGRSGCICGALSGAMIIIGAAKGRTTPGTPRKESYDLSSEYHDMFKKKFGATCCRALNRHQFGSKEQGETCYRIITESAGLMMEFLIEKGIVAENQ